MKIAPVDLRTLLSQQLEHYDAILVECSQQHTACARRWTELRRAGANRGEVWLADRDRKRALANLREKQEERQQLLLILALPQEQFLAYMRESKRWWC